MEEPGADFEKPLQYEHLRSFASRQCFITDAEYRVYLKHWADAGLRIAQQLLQMFDEHVASKNRWREPMADLATLQTRLNEAETAYHKLRTGASEEEVEHGDMRVRYTRSLTGMQELGTYISNLRAQIVAAGGTVDGLSRKAIGLDL